MFLCGALSILTTIGIVYGLAKESLGFFTPELWEDSNKTLAAAIGPAATAFELSAGGQEWQDGHLLRLGEEQMRIVTIAVPRSLQEAACALGATRLETAVKVVVPAALIVFAFPLGVGAAIYWKSTPPITGSAT